MSPAKQTKKGGMIVTDAEKTVERIAGHKNVDGVIVCNREGIPMNTTMDSTATTLFVDGLMTLEKRCSSIVRELDPLNEIKFLRITSQKFDISMAPRGDHIGFIVQRRGGPQ